MQGMFGRLLVIIGYVLVLCGILTISFSLLGGIVLLLVSAALINNITLRKSTPKQLFQALAGNIQCLLACVAFVLLGMWLESRYHLYDDQATLSYFVLAATTLVFVNLYVAKNKSSQKSDK